MLDGLRWLVRHQNPDGSWSALGLESRCVPEAPCYDPALKRNDHYDEGLTGLALLCFLGAGFGPQSKQDLVDTALAKRHKIGVVVGNGLEWLRKKQKPDGSFSEDRAFLYNEAIATLALVECYGLTKDFAWREPAQRAVDFIQAAQRRSPAGEGLWGWRYASREEVEKHRPVGSDLRFEKELYDADTSVTAWCVLALRSAHRVGLRVRQESMDGAMAFCRFVTTENGAVGYIDAKSAGATVTGPFDGEFTYHPTTMSALGMCIRMFVESDLDDPFLDLSAKRIVQDLPIASEDRKSIDYYYWHCASVALHQLDGPDSPRRSGKYWGVWNKSMLEAVLSLQDHAEHACTNGGWIESDRWGSYSGAGPLYNTAMNVLTLEVYYRYENVFDRRESTDVGASAPDFEGWESSGSRFRLSDYRGSVVLIDFWSPHTGDFEASLEARSWLAEQKRGRPFVILGVVIDRQIDREKDPGYAEVAARHGAVWRWTRESWADKSVHWKYRISRPSTVVVDATGTIRGRGLSWEETSALVIRLIEETERNSRPK